MIVFISNKKYWRKFKKNTIVSILTGSCSGKRCVKSCCTSSWSVGEPSPSSGTRGRNPLLGCKAPSCVRLGAGTPRRCAAASSAPPWSSSSLWTAEGRHNDVNPSEWPKYITGSLMTSVHGLKNTRNHWLKCCISEWVPPYLTTFVGYYSAISTTYILHLKRRLNWLTKTHSVKHVCDCVSAYQLQVQPQKLRLSRTSLPAAVWPPFCQTGPQSAAWRSHWTKHLRPPWHGQKDIQGDSITKLSAPISEKHTPVMCRQ